MQSFRIQEIKLNARKQLDSQNLVAKVDVFHKATVVKFAVQL